jgi:CDP-glucose 4,6-dehydratase
MSKKILVTGASGFIGAHLVDALKGKNQVFSMIRDDHPEWVITSKLKDSTIIHGDVTNVLTMRRALVENDIECVVHLAAQSIVRQSQKDPYGTYMTNVMGAVAVLEAARTADTKHVIVQSTDKIYGTKTSSITTDPVMPSDPYSTSKSCADLIAQSYAKTYGMKIAITRPCNVYGYDWNPRIIPNTIRTCLCGESPIIFKDRKEKRQYIYIDDVVATFSRFIEDKTVGIHNLSTPDILDQEEVVQRVLQFFPQLLPIYVDGPKISELGDEWIINDSVKDSTPFDIGIEKTILQYDVQDFACGGKWVGKRTD